jgi:o-succinylbenzoate synthase
MTASAPSRRAALFRYRIPFVGAHIVRSSAFETREGLILRLSEHHREGWGEAAPLPGFSHETLAQAKTELQHAAQCWLNNATPPETLCPSAAFAFSCACAELDESLPAAMMTEGALLCDDDLEIAIRRLRATPEIMLAKLKLGRHTPAEDAARTRRLLEAFPALRLRLDANRAYTLDDAHRFAEVLPQALRERIVFIEEPCATREASRAFARSTHIVIAWDESTREPDFVVQREEGVAAIIVKPTLIGDLARCRALCQAAHHHQLDAVISSSVESTLGLTQLARIAAWLTPGTVPGLDTADALAQQVLRSWPGNSKPTLMMNDLEAVWRA